MKAQLTQQAVEMLKQNAPPEVVVARLVALGADPGEAQSHVDELARLKQEAEVAAGPRLDVEALRDLMWSLMLRRAPIEQIIAAAAQHGVLEEHARAEIYRMSTLKPCGLCGARMQAGESFFNTSGNEICRRCHAGEQIGAAERRIHEAQLEAAGVMAYDIAEKRRPRLCPQCRQQTLMPAAAIDPGPMHLSFTSSVAFRCGACGFYLRPQPR